MNISITYRLLILSVLVIRMKVMEFQKKHNRTRDYTPTDFKPKDNKHFLSNSPEEYVGSGGANDFLEIVSEEIIPFIEKRFQVNNDRVLIAKSMSGLAAVHSFLTKPELFNRYLIVSPSIWWDDFFYPRDERFVQRKVSELKPDSYPNETRVYFAVGSEEERFGLVTDLYVLVNSLNNRRAANLKVRLEVLDDEIHEGVFPASFMRGILALYADESGLRESGSKIKWK